MKLHRIIALVLALACSPALAQTNPGTSPLSIAKGGTSASTASGARTALGLAIGSATQAWDADLDCLAALAGTGILRRTGAGTCSNGTVVSVAEGGTGVTSLGTGVVTALGVNVGSAGAFVTFNGALGTPSSGTGTNITGLPISTGVSGLGSNVAAFLATASSANLRAALTDETGTGVAYFAGGDIGTPSAGVATNITGLPVASGISGLGTGVATALAVNVGSAGAFVTFNGALGTPSSGTLTNATGLPIATGVSGLGANVATALATPSSANVAAAVSDETGTGALVFANSPALAGTPTAPTASMSDNSTKVATTAYVDAQVAGGVAGVASLNGQTGALVSYFTPQGRLTLTSGIPVLTSDVTAAATVFYTPYLGDMVPLYDGTNIVPTAFAEVSQTLADATKSPAATSADNNYDIFCWTDAGTKRCTRGPAWSSATTRGTGAGTTELVRTKGLLLNANSITNGPAASRGTYVGTIRTNGSNQVDMMLLPAAASGGAANRLYVWNMYNRVNVSSTNMESADTWTYTTATFRAMNNSGGAGVGNAITFVVGVAEDAFDAATVMRSANTAAGTARATAIGYDSTSAAQSGNLMTFPAASDGNATVNHLGTLSMVPGIGRHFICPLEYSNASGTTTWYGDGTVPTLVQSGTTFKFRM